MIQHDPTEGSLFCSACESKISVMHEESGMEIWLKGHIEHIDEGLRSFVMDRWRFCIEEAKRYAVFKEKMARGDIVLEQTVIPNGVSMRWVDKSAPASTPPCTRRQVDGNGDGPASAERVVLGADQFSIETNPEVDPSTVVISVSHGHEEPERNYKRPSFAIVASDGRGHGEVLEYRGGHLGYEFEENGCGFADIFGDAPRGITVWMGGYVDDGASDWEGGAREVRIEGAFRELTDEEWEHYEAGGLMDVLYPETEKEVGR